MKSQEAVQRLRLRDPQVHGHLVSNTVDRGHVGWDDPTIRPDQGFEGVDQHAVIAVEQGTDINQMWLTRIIAWVAPERDTGGFGVVG
ncbi:hypothetical protein D3C85_1386450 [compost metagenome]